MARASRRHRRLGGTVARADDQIVAVEIELFDRKRKQRQVAAVV
jgi:hypothetical protein